MPRSVRIAPGGVPFHVINRAVGRQRLFFGDDDYLAFEKVVIDTLAKAPLRVCAYCLMPTHWHLVVWPERDGQLKEFMKRLTVTHTARWKQSKGQVGMGHLYQGRYKSFPIQSDEHFLHVARYVEANALRAGLVRRAEDWEWSSLWIRENVEQREFSVLANWPLPQPPSWLAHVNRPPATAELDRLRRSVKRGTPYGDEGWVARTAKRLGLEATTRPLGRPRKSVAAPAC
ncbi:MAG: transposase [Planctomycetota bacterium]|nr:MAG: transposase [Planctomycetota bacterium]REJ88876.1 MAG: transposase [Planctomycetota bacterium]REK25770.1 MAG: transposase [Planctomycetota bacterium]REK46643.1 MAG: transposase [Planctomycetota bacterium]